jgi:hypothetical protein
MCTRHGDGPRRCPAAHAAARVRTARRVGEHLAALQHLAAQLATGWWQRSRQQELARDNFCGPQGMTWRVTWLGFLSSRASPSSRLLAAVPKRRDCGQLACGARRAHARGSAARARGVAAGAGRYGAPHAVCRTRGRGAPLARARRRGPGRVRAGCARAACSCGGAVRRRAQPAGAASLMALRAEAFCAGSSRLCGAGPPRRCRTPSPGCEPRLVRAAPAGCSCCFALARVRKDAGADS